VFEALRKRSGLSLCVTLLASVIVCVPLWSQDPPQSSQSADQLSISDAQSLLYLLPQARKIRSEGMDVSSDVISAPERKGVDFYDFWVIRGSAPIGIFSVNRYTGDVWKNGENPAKIEDDPQIERVQEGLRETHRIDGTVLAKYQVLRPEPITKDAFFLLWVGRTKRHPSDAALKGSFLKNKTDFGTLVTMSNEDKRVVRIATDFTWLDTDGSWPRKEIGFTEERWKSYRTLFWKVGVFDGIVRPVDYPSAIFFLASTVGLVVNGSTKGYVFSTAPVSPIQQSLEDDPGKVPRGYVFEPIAPNWYLYTER
jgi:hypothetical protein